MKSSMKPTRPPLAEPLAGPKVLSREPEASKDPYAVLDDLMVVVESLCPRWPERKTFRAGDVFKL